MNYSPFPINSGTSSLCIDIKFSQLCEEYDYTEINENKVLSCKKCKKISDIKQLVSDGTLKLTSDDFLETSFYDNSVDNVGNISYSDILSNYSHIRAALFRKNRQLWCWQYIGTDNCSIHDDSSLD